RSWLDEFDDGVSGPALEHVSVRDVLTVVHDTDRFGVYGEFLIWTESFRHLIRSLEMACEDQIFAKVQEILVEALGVDDDEVTPEATLMGDLGAESIDFLDIVFRLEKAFDIKIPRGELFPENLMSADSGFVKDGKITEEGIQEF